MCLYPRISLANLYCNPQQNSSNSATFAPPVFFFFLIFQTLPAMRQQQPGSVATPKQLLVNEIDSTHFIEDNGRKKEGKEKENLRQRQAQGSFIVAEKRWRRKRKRSGRRIRTAEEPSSIQFSRLRSQTPCISPSASPTTPRSLSGRSPTSSSDSFPLPSKAPQVNGVVAVLVLVFFVLFLLLFLCFFFSAQHFSFLLRFVVSVVR